MTTKDGSTKTTALTPSRTTRAERKAAKRAASEARKAKAAENASLEKSMPTLNAVLKEIGFSYEQRIDWLTHAKSTPVSEQEIVAIVAPDKERSLEKPSKAKRALKTKMIVAGHGLRRWYRGRNFIFGLIYTSSWTYLLLATASKLAWSLGAIISVATILIAKLRFVSHNIKSKDMQLVNRGYNERKVMFQKLLETAQRWYEAPPTADQLEHFRRDALSLVAGYVRDHRARFGSRAILANLLIRDGNEIVVVGRSDAGLRPVPKRYSHEECALVWHAIETGEAQLTGDLYSDFPNTVQGKKYNSILVVPIWYRNAVIGAVSIDSQEKYHFHIDFDDLQIHLSPYVQLLAATLLAAHDRSDVKILGPAGSELYLKGTGDVT